MIFRKGMAKILGGVAVVVGDATLSAAGPVAAASVVAGTISCFNGVDEAQTNS